VILLLVLGLGWPFSRHAKRAIAWGLAIGITLQGLLYLDLYKRIQDPGTAWVDEHALTTVTGFGRFVLGLPFEHFFMWAPANLAIVTNPLALGLQATALVFVALLAPVLIRPRRLGWTVWMVLVWHLLFISVYRVADPEPLFLPPLWLGIVCVGLAFHHLPIPLRTQAGKAFFAMMLLLSVINQRGLTKNGITAWQQEFRTVLSSVPEDTVLLSDDWKSRTALVAIR
jgi:hypothetical protein